MRKMYLPLMLMIASLGFGQNLITNGNFESGSTGWSGNAVNVVTEGGNSYNAANVASAGNPWDVNLSYVTPITTSGTAYKLTFQAWSDTNRPLIAGIGLNQDPWSSDVQTVNLTTTAQTFVLNLTANFANVNSRIIFDMGNAVGFVGIDNVVLEQVTTTCNNNVQDGDETGVDCGGSCSPCVVTPSVAAPTPPARSASDVVSIYSDAYTPISIGNFDAGWCGGAATTPVMIAGNNTLKKNTGVNCHGIDFSVNRQNLTDFTHLHFDFYVTDTDLAGDVFNVKLVQMNAAGTAEVSALEVNINGGTTPQLVANQWVSVDVPITALGGVVAGNLARNNIGQIGITTANVSNVWYDNIYLHKNNLGTDSILMSKDENSVYPNPVKSGENVYFSHVESVTLLNQHGQVIKQTTLNYLNLAGVKSGIYFIKILDKNGNKKTQKLIIK